MDYLLQSIACTSAYRVFAFFFFFTCISRFFIIKNKEKVCLIIYKQVALSLNFRQHTLSSTSYGLVLCNTPPHTGQQIMHKQQQMLYFLFHNKKDDNYNVLKYHLKVQCIYLKDSITWHTSCMTIIIVKWGKLIMRLTNMPVLVQCKSTRPSEPTMCSYPVSHCQPQKQFTFAEGRIIAKNCTAL